MPRREASVEPRYRSDGRRVCSAHRSNGEPCNALAMQAQGTCYTHGGAAPQARAAAQRRIEAAADSAAAHLITWMNSSSVPYNIRLAAAKDLLDRAQIGIDKSIKVELRRFEQNIEGLIVDLPRDIVDAEVVEDALPAALPPAPPRPGARRGTQPSRRTMSLQVGG